MSQAWDVVVVGAGPAGAVAALEAQRAGLRVLVLEKDEAGRGKTCAGGISPAARGHLKRLGLWERVEAEAYLIRGMRLVSPSGREATLVGAETAVVLRRERFDALLAEAAASAGATFLWNRRCDGLVERGGRVIGVRCGSEEIGARYVIVANGAMSRLCPDPRPKSLLHACLSRFEGVPFEPHVLEMIYDPELLPHYGWLFPEGPGRVNIGICLFEETRRRRSLRDVFLRFLDRHFGKRLAGARQEGRLMGHPISTCTSVEHHAAEGVFVAGEALRLTNMATGEGISHAIWSGALAARAVREAETVGALEATRRYVQTLQRTFIPGFLLANLFTRFGTPVLDALTFALGLPGVRRLVQRRA